MGNRTDAKVILLLCCIICLIVCIPTWTKLKALTSLTPTKTSDKRGVDPAWNHSQTRTPSDGGATQEQNDFQKKRGDSEQAEQKEADHGGKSEPDMFMEQQASIQSERRRHLREMCRKHPELSQGGISSMTLRHTFVNDKYKILFCAVPKTACSNWKRVLMVLGGVRNQTAGITLTEAHTMNQMASLKRFSLSERRHKIQTYTKFMYARQPFHRLLSVFRDKIEGEALNRQIDLFRNIAKGIMERYRPNATARDLETGENITWSEWISYITNSTERAGFEYHWLEIHKVCSPCQIHYDYVGKLETVADDSRYMLTSLKVQDKVNFPTGDDHQTNSSQVYNAYFDRVPKASLQRLWEIYKLDFELFGYNKPDSL